MINFKTIKCNNDNNININNNIHDLCTKLMYNVERNVKMRHQYSLNITYFKDIKKCLGRESNSRPLT